MRIKKTTSCHSFFSGIVGYEMHTNARDSRLPRGHVTRLRFLRGSLLSRVFACSSRTAFFEQKEEPLVL